MRPAARDNFIINILKQSDMKTLLTIALFLLMTAGWAQNYITNGSDWTDSDSDGLADGWTIGLDNNPDIIDGCQLVTSLQQPKLKQVINIPNPIGRTFRIRFDIESVHYTQLIIWVSPYYSYVQSIPNPQPPGAWSYDITFTYTQPEIYAIMFQSLNYNSWIKLDNVSMVELFPVGITEQSKPEPQPEYYDLSGRRLTGEPSHGVYLKKVGNSVKKYGK